MTNLWVHAGSLFLLLLLQQTEISEARSYNNGLIFYDLRTRTPYLPPTVSVSRGRNLASVKYSEKGSIWSTFGQPCDCRGPTCGCCAGLKVDQYKFDQKMCANITFVPQLEEAQLEVFMNGRPSSKYGISVRNPSPFCIPVMMGVPMAMCVQMTDIAMVGNNLNMCMDFVVRLATTDLFEMHFQCMGMGLDGIQYVDKNGQPVLPSSAKEEEVAQEEEEEEDYFAPDTNEGAVEYDYAGEAEAELQQEKEQQGLEPTDKLLVVVQDTVSEEEEEQQQQQQQQQQLDSVVAAYVPQPLPIESEMLMAVDNELAGEPLSEDSDMDATTTTTTIADSYSDNDSSNISSNTSDSNHSESSESDLKQNEVIETITNSIEAATTAATTTTAPATTTTTTAPATATAATTTTTTTKPNIAVIDDMNNYTNNSDTDDNNNNDNDNDNDNNYDLEPAAATKLEAVAPSDNNDVADADVAALTAEIDENDSDNEVNIDNDEQQEEVAEDGEEKEEKEEEEGEKKTGDKAAKTETEQEKEKQKEKEVEAVKETETESEAEAEADTEMEMEMEDEEAEAAMEGADDSSAGAETEAEAADNSNESVTSNDNAPVAPNNSAHNDKEPKREAVDGHVNGAATTANYSNNNNNSNELVENAAPSTSISTAQQQPSLSGYQRRLRLRRVL